MSPWAHFNSEEYGITSDMRRWQFTESEKMKCLSPLWFKLPFPSSCVHLTTRWKYYYFLLVMSYDLLIHCQHWGSSRTFKRIWSTGPPNRDYTFLVWKFCPSTFRIKATAGFDLGFHFIYFLSFTMAETCFFFSITTLSLVWLVRVSLSL